MIYHYNKHKRWRGLSVFKYHNPAILYWSAFIKSGDWLIMYMYVKEIAFRILQKVYACVWEYKNNNKNQEAILSRQYIYMNNFIVMLFALLFVWVVI